MEFAIQQVPVRLPKGDYCIEFPFDSSSCATYARCQFLKDIGWMNNSAWCELFKVVLKDFRQDSCGRAIHEKCVGCPK